MGTKDNPGTFDCYGNALPDEPMFVLLARDPNAPDLVRDWAIARFNDIQLGVRPPKDMAMIEEALTCAEAMRQWRIEHNGKWRQPKVALTPLCEDHHG